MTKPQNGQASRNGRHSSDTGGTRKWWVLAAVGAGTYMSALDGSVVNVILPLVSRRFHSSVASVEWVVTVYLLVVSAVLLSFGRLGDLKGHKPIYSTGFIIFVISSALCGQSHSTAVLVAFRGVQALGAAMLFANAPAILTMSFPAEQRGQALGLMGMMTYLGLTTGPTLGGWLATAFGWPAVFYINVPVGLLALGLCRRFVPAGRPADAAQPFDLAGAAAFTVGMVGLLLALNQGHAWGWLSGRTLGLLLASMAVLVAFLRLEARVPAPMLDLTLFRTRVFSASVGSAVLNYMAISGVVFLLPFYLIQGRGFSARHAGLLLSAQSLVMAIVTPMSGWLSDRIGSRTPATVGMAVMTLGMFWLSRLGVHTSMLTVAAGLAVVGLGTGTFIAPNNNALMGAAPRERQGIAGGVLAAARNVGMVMGVGMAAAVFTTVLQGQGAHAGLPALTHAVDLSLLTAMGLAAAGIVTSAVR